MRNRCPGFSWALLLGVLLAVAPLVVAQTTIATGSIQGTVTDPSGAVVPQAKVTITNTATGQVVTPPVSSAGTYSSGALIPGNYKVRVEAKGFKATEMPAVVQVGVTTPGSIKLQVGSETQTVNVEAGAVRINTEQATIQGVLTAQQIDQLPINGRNFLDLAQLEPGVQIQDGGNFDPTKNGFTGVSIEGRNGRTARIEVDGIDISDETVGTTTQNIPQGAIQEFQVQQSSLDLSTELTSSGAVNVTTRSGTNAYHGEGFYLFRDKATAANMGQDVPFQRNQFGGRLGGPIIKNKLFFFADGERTKQDLLAPVVTPAPFTPLSTGGFNSPFRENLAMGRLDWQIRPDNWRVFYRFSYDINSNVATFIANTFQPFVNRNNTPVHLVGLDFNTGSFTHAIRAGLTKQSNHIGDAVLGSSIVNPSPDVAIAIGTDPFCTTPGADVWCSGPNILAPQVTIQENKQIKYDGTKTHGSHIIRFGVGFNHIKGGGGANFFGIQPIVQSDQADASIAVGGPFPGGASNPLNYPVRTIVMGNGQGFFTETPAFGFPGGGQHDNRLSWYVGDAWKVKPNFTLNYGLRYVRDTGRTDSDLPPIPCSAVDRTTFPDFPCPAGQNILDQLMPGLGARIRQPNANFAPQVGIAWDPTGGGKTVIRAGAGLFYENAIFNNVLFDRPPRLAKGLFNGVAEPCPAGSFTEPDGTVVDASAICGAPIGTVAPQILALQKQFQAITAAQGAAKNGLFLGNLLAANPFGLGTTLYAPNYQSPRSWQINAGIQRQFGRGTVLSADYVRNIGLHFLDTVDVNHVGDARFLNMPAALNAIALTNTSFGCPTTVAGINCAIAAGAKITDYAGNGLDSGAVLLGGVSPEAAGVTPATGAAFAGINPFFGPVQMGFSGGRSVYNALQVRLKQQIANPVRGLANVNLQVSYSLSRFENNISTGGGDQDFINQPGDFANPTKFFGPSGLDRTHQIAFGAVLQFAHRGPVVSFTSGFYTGGAASLTLPAANPTGAIFSADITGDGTGAGDQSMTGGDFLPGTNLGAFGRSVTTSNLNSVITNFNNNFAGKLTPAGQALVSAGLFTPAQLTALGGVIQPVALAPKGQVGLDAFRSFDLKTSWPIHIKERFVIEPNVSMYNLFNFSNFDPQGQPLSGNLNGQPLTANGTTAADRTNRIRPGSGVFWYGVPRVFEWGLRMTF